MSIDSLKDVYVDQLQDLYSANGQSIKVIRDLAEHASNPELKEALERGIAGITDGMKVLTELTSKHGVRPGRRVLPWHGRAGEGGAFAQHR